jgi:hypothetical protein
MVYGDANKPVRFTMAYSSQAVDKPARYSLPVAGHSMFTRPGQTYITSVFVLCQSPPSYFAPKSNSLAKNQLTQEAKANSQIRLCMLTLDNTTLRTWEPHCTILIFSHSSALLRLVFIILFSSHVTTLTCVRTQWYMSRSHAEKEQQSRGHSVVGVGCCSTHRHTHGQKYYNPDLLYTRLPAFSCPSFAL